MHRKSKRVSQDMAGLKEIEGNPAVHSINIVADYWDTMWQAYFLMRKKIFMETSTYFAASPLEGEWNLTLVGGAEGNILNVSGFDSIDTIPVNSTYKLERAMQPRLLRARFGNGWHDSEKTHRWTGGDSNRSGIVLECATDGLSFDLHASYYPLNPDNSLAIYFNGEEKAKCRDNSSCMVSGLVLMRGENLLEFRMALHPTHPPNGDPRRLGYAFKSIDITAVGNQEIR
jgi:hypothetical protein